jgi:Transposase and inactivated derivatives
MTQVANNIGESARNASVETSGIARENRAARNASVVEIEVIMLGISEEHLVRPIDDQHVAYLRDTDETEWEPIELRRWPKEWNKPTPEVEYHVISGNHRTSAARIKGLKTVRARILEVDSDLDYLTAAIRTNTRHGRNFTEDERRVNAAKLKDLGMSGSQIANLFGVHKSTVNNWLSGRDTNVSKKKNARQQAEDTLANLGIEDLSKEWQFVPEVTTDARQLAKVGQTINNFLAETPTAENKAHIMSWVQSLSKESRYSIADDMRETIQWLTNVAMLLKSDR